MGAPLTPNALNDGQTTFSEHHHVYVEAQHLDAYLWTGSFPEGTVFVKELPLVLDPTFADGSRREPSGRGYFNGDFNGILFLVCSVLGGTRRLRSTRRTADGVRAEVQTASAS